MTLPEFPEKIETGTAAPRPAPLKFEPSLVPRLRGAHAAMNARFSEVLSVIEQEPAASARMIEECARQFSALRHIETIWVYPLLAHAVESDAGARSQLAELRLIGMILARRVLRCFDDAQQAVRGGVYVADTARHVSTALARYSRHSESTIYPLYEELGVQDRNAAQVA